MTALPVSFATWKARGLNSARRSLTSWQPGLSEIAIRHALEPVTTNPCREVVEWFVWRNGLVPGVRQMALGPFGFEPYSLSLASRNWTQRWGLARDAAADANAGGDSSVSPEYYWSPGWLSIATDLGQADLAVDIVSDEEACLVRCVDWEDVYGFRDLAASSLTEVIDLWVVILRSSYCRFDATKKRFEWVPGYASLPAEWRTNKRHLTPMMRHCAAHFIEINPVSDFHAASIGESHAGEKAFRSDHCLSFGTADAVRLTRPSPAPSPTNAKPGFRAGSTGGQGPRDTTIYIPLVDHWCSGSRGIGSCRRCPQTRLHTAVGKIIQRILVAEKCPSDTARLYRDGRMTPYRMWQGAQNGESFTLSGRSGEAQMTMKNVILWLVVIFVVFFIVTQPSEAANIAHSLWNGIVNIFHGIGDFVSSL